jgi:hypothetical protein
VIILAGVEMSFKGMTASSELWAIIVTTEDPRLITKKGIFSTKALLISAADASR